MNPPRDTRCLSMPSRMREGSPDISRDRVSSLADGSPEKNLELISPTANRLVISRKVISEMISIYGDFDAYLYLNLMSTAF